MAQIAQLSSLFSAETTAAPVAELLPIKIKAVDIQSAKGRIAAEAQGKDQNSSAPNALLNKMSPSEQDGMMNQLNKTLEAFDTHVSLSIDEKSHQNVIKVIDNQSGKVIRQIPSEQLLRISDRITELLGVIYDEKM
jgi:flagellar protein FlaG